LRRGGGVVDIAHLRFPSLFLFTLLCYTPFLRSSAFFSLHLDAPGVLLFRLSVCFLRSLSFSLYFHSFFLFNVLFSLRVGLFLNQAKNFFRSHPRSSSVPALLYYPIATLTYVVSPSLSRSLPHPLTKQQYRRYYLLTLSSISIPIILIHSNIFRSTYRCTRYTYCVALSLSYRIIYIAMFLAATEGIPLPPDKHSPEFVDFLTQCLQIDQAKRVKSSELLKHPFLTKADTQDTMRKILAQIFISNAISNLDYGL